MSKYPEYQNNRLIVNNVDITTNFQLVLIDGYTLSPPEPKFYTVDVPGGNGVINLTESLTGDVLFSTRSQDFIFNVLFPNDFEEIKTKLSNFLHGKEFDYVMTMDPDYTYHGTFQVTAYSHQAYSEGIVGEVQIHIDANPYKRLTTKVYHLNAAGGRLYHFPSGRKPVRPVIETKQATKVIWNDTVYQIGVGTFRLNKVLFKEGINDLYINTFEIFDTLWQDLGNGGKHRMTWDQASEYTWDEIQRIEIDEAVIAMSWDDLNQTRWNELTSQGVRWRDLDYKPDSSDSSAYISYDWEDL